MDQHGSYDCGVKNEEVERIIYFCAAMSMILGNTLF